jgi:hypothetical protein
MFQNIMLLPFLRKLNLVQVDAEVMVPVAMRPEE